MVIFLKGSVSWEESNSDILVMYDGVSNINKKWLTKKDPPDGVSSFEISKHNITETDNRILFYRGNDPTLQFAKCYKYL